MRGALGGEWCASSTEEKQMETKRGGEEVDGEDGGKREQKSEHLEEMAARRAFLSFAPAFTGWGEDCAEVRQG